MPSLGADMDSGKVLEWLVSPGDTVHRGDVIAVVDTAKAAIEVEVFHDGVVTALLVEPGESVAVGTPLATIDEQPAHRAPAETGDTAEPGPAGEASSDREPVPPLSPPVRHLAHQLDVDLSTLQGTGPDGAITREDIRSAARVPPEQPLPSQSPPSMSTTKSEEPLPVDAGRGPATRAETPADRIRATPRARRVAAEQGLDLSAVDGSGPHGAVTEADVMGAIGEDRTPPPAEGHHVDHKQAMRAAIASLMGRSAREIPHYYVSQTIDFAQPLQWLRRHNAELKPRQRVLPVVLLLHATVRAALQVPDLNGHWVDDGFAGSEAVHLGVAVATRTGGLITPTIRDAQEHDVDSLMEHLRDLVKRARVGTLKAHEMQPGSITTTSLADGGADTLHGVIYPPQVALVGFGAIAERPWADQGMLTVRPTLTVTLAADHRASDGRTGAAFLTALSQALTQPEES